MKKTPVILDTDIGDDIDDTWALAMLLRCPELDVRLIVGAFGEPVYRGRLIAQLLHTAGRTEVAVGLGTEVKNDKPKPHRQEQWITGDPLGDYPGTVQHDGIGAMIDIIMRSDEPVTLIAIGPMTNLAIALQREPRIAQRTRFVGMCGSIYGSHKNVAGPIAEYNIVKDIAAAQAVFAASWDMTITPVDTCGFVRLEGEAYQRVRSCNDPLIQAVLENYRIWEQAGGRSNDCATQSTVLFDTVAVYLAYAADWLGMEDLSLCVTDEGRTQIAPRGRTVHCATQWRDKPAFIAHLTDRLSSA